MNVKITQDGNRITVVSPFHNDFAGAARQLGGKWNGSAWTFDARDTQRVRDLLMDMFGTDGTPCKLVTIRVVADTAIIKTQQGKFGGASIYLDGMPVAKVRTKNDDSAMLSDGIVITSGKFYGGGSTRNPDVNWDRGTVFEMRDIPAAKAEAIREKHPELIEILDSPLSPDDAAVSISPEQQELMAERTKLMDRLAEIDGLLAEYAAHRPVRVFEVADDLRDHD